MTVHMQRLSNAYHRLGAVGLARRIAREAYARTLRPFLPKTPALYSGIPVAIYGRVGDRALKALLGTFDDGDDIETYEETLLAGLRSYVRAGDRVAIVGGGAGVTVVVAARCVGEHGTVSCFEGSARQAAIARETAALNHVADRVTVRHAVVGPAISVYGGAGGAENVSAAALPTCDVLELDCEGAEVEILQQLPFHPRIILVETHGLYGASTALCERLLEARGYRVRDLGVAEPRAAAFCEAKDIRVLVGELSPAA